jgi:hypothetical protein
MAALKEMAEKIDPDSSKDSMDGVPFTKPRHEADDMKQSNICFPRKGLRLTNEPTWILAGDLVGGAETRTNKTIELLKSMGQLVCRGCRKSSK